ncbi:MAG: bifunctional acetate--CoA ligase family protein/GNAT family N-acetyltransferase [Desulfobacterium sp.]|nr:bifunctional acetate--CoA ligase family protein/GNAT family N-acetyltransferase [Desulfobacterium sp.]
MGTLNLDRMFNPASVAVIGASERGGSVGESVMENLVGKGYQGKVYPVNMKHDTIMGLKAYPHVGAIKQAVDLAVIATPMATVPDTVASCGNAGVAGCVVISAGGKETGAKGAKIEASIMAAAGRTGIRIVGPNCLGMVNTANGLNASFAPQLPLPGKIAFLSQSGAVCTSVLDLAMREKVGFSHFVSLGSMADVDFADMIDYLGTVKEVESIVMYVESLTNIRNFMSAARGVSRIKPIIALKSGRSEAGARAAASHTGAMAGDDAIYDAAFKRAGILRVDDFQELFDCTEFLAKQQRPKGARLAIVTNSGGPGVMAADALGAQGAEPALLSDETISRLDALLPSSWSRQNPVDILGDASPETYINAARICMEAPETDGLLLICSPVGMYDPSALAKPLAAFLKTGTCPVFTAWIGGTHIDKARKIFNQAGVITYDTPERGVRAFMNLYQYGKNIEMLHEIPIRRDKRLLIDRARAREIIQMGLAEPDKGLTEVEAKDLLRAYGIPVNRCDLAETREEAVALARNMGFPVALKICSRDILHKSDSGGVQLNLGDETRVRQAFELIMASARNYDPTAHILGVTVQSMNSGADYELIMGAKQDDAFGPVVLFGMGGVMTEVFRDTAMGLPPLNRPLASTLINGTRISRVLDGFRNIPAVDRELVEEILIRLGRLVTDFPEIDALDINPVLVSRGALVAVDARVVVKPSAKVAPGHLVISSYPWDQEAEDVTVDNERIYIRPIRPEDAGLMIEHFNALSPKSVYQRFFFPMKQLSKWMLIRLTQVDYDREVALIALVDTPSGRKMAGVARVIREANGKNGEFAVAVADQWQGRGIGASLLKRCLRLSKQKGLGTVWGLVIAENRQMLKLGKKLGFEAARVSGSSEYELKIDLSTLN